MRRRGDVLWVALRLSGLGVLGVVGRSRSTVSGSDCEVMCGMSLWVLSRYSAWKAGFCVAKSMASMLCVKHLCSGAYIEQRVSCGAVRECARGAKLGNAGRARIKARMEARMADPLPVALVKQELAVKENAVHEVLPNDVEEQANDTVNKGWSKDQWMSGVLERALRIVARSAAKGEQEFGLSPFLRDSVKFAVSEDKELGTFYRDNVNGIFSQRYLGQYFPIDNVELKTDNNTSIHVQGTQRPDSISLLNLTSKGKDQKVCICFEGDAHDLDANKSNAGMFSYEKMFQDVSLCHDVNPNVPGIFITSVLWKHDKYVFPTFSNWAEQFLKEHVLLVEQLLQYISDKETSSIHRALCGIDKGMAETREFDFFCWINAQDVKNEGFESFDSTVEECFNVMYEKTRDNNEELKDVLKWRNMYGTRNDWVAGKVAGQTNSSDDGLENSGFRAITIRSNVNGIPVVIFAVPRVSKDALNGLVVDRTTQCSGMWYPMHVHAYVDSLKQTMKNFLVSNGNAGLFEAFSSLPNMDKKKMLKKQTFESDYKTQMQGQLLFTLPWLWINIGFLCKLKSSLSYGGGQRRARANTIAAYIAFTRKHATHVNSRDNVKNDMEMFTDESSSLFAHLCRARQATAGVDEDLGAFLQNKCGWTNATSASSPAVFFALLGVRNLITAHTLAKRCSGAPNKYSVELEKVKDTFPLAAQVEIDYALECLCRHYYFVQDKSAVQDDVVPRAEFERMQRKLRKEVEAANGRIKVAQGQFEAAQGQVEVAQPEVKEEEEEGEEGDNDTSQVDRGGYKPLAGEKVSDVPTETDMNVDFLKTKQLVVKFNIQSKLNERRWYRGKVTGQTRNKEYNIHFDDGEDRNVPLNVLNYGQIKKWVMVEKVNS